VILEREVTVVWEQGLHARPAARFVQEANKFRAAVTVSNGRRSVPAKGLIGILSLGVKKGDTVRLTAEGEDAEAAMAALVGLLTSPEPQG